MQGSSKRHMEIYHRKCSLGSVSRTCIFNYSTCSIVDNFSIYSFFPFLYNNIMTFYFRTVRKVKGNLALYPYIVHVCVCKYTLKVVIFQFLMMAGIKVDCSFKAKCSTNFNRN